WASGSLISSTSPRTLSSTMKTMCLAGGLIGPSYSTSARVLVCKFVLAVIAKIICSEKGGGKKCVPPIVYGIINEIIASATSGMLLHRNLNAQVGAGGSARIIPTPKTHKQLRTKYIIYQDNPSKPLWRSNQTSRTIERSRWVPVMSKNIWSTAYAGIIKLTSKMRIDGLPRNGMIPKHIMVIQNTMV